jgi:hypothetical protein
MPGLRVDIELGDQGTLLGDAWLNFIGEFEIHARGEQREQPA